jgi:hypothetical protein
MRDVRLNPNFAVEVIFWMWLNDLVVNCREKRDCKEEREAKMLLMVAGLLS